MRIHALAALAALTVATPFAAIAADKTFDVDPFTEITISSGLDAVVTVGGTTQSVVASSPRQEEIDELIIEVRNGQLYASTNWNILDIFDFGAGERQTTITIAVPALSAATSDSGSDVNVTGMGGELVMLRSSSGSDLNAFASAGLRYDINSSSGSDLNVEGTCESAKIVASSGSTLRADRLLCADVDANASSGSNADVYASGSLKADASSGSDLTVHGKPTSTELNSSSGANININ